MSSHSTRKEINPGPVKALERHIHVDFFFLTLAYVTIDDLKDAGD